MRLRGAKRCPAADPGLPDHSLVTGDGHPCVPSPEQGDRAPRFLIDSAPLVAGVNVVRPRLRLRALHVDPRSSLARVCKQEPQGGGGPAFGRIIVFPSGTPLDLRGFVRDAEVGRLRGIPPLPQSRSYQRERRKLRPPSVLRAVLHRADARALRLFVRVVVCPVRAGLAQEAPELGTQVRFVHPCGPCVLAGIKVITQQ